MRHVLSLLSTALFLGLSVSNAQDFWEQTNGPTGGAISSLAINSSGDIFVGGEGTGVFRSTDNGNSWRRIDRGLTGIDVNALAVNPNAAIIAGTGNGVYRSTENGDSWSQVGLPNIKVMCLAINASGYIFAGGGGDVYRSTDNGDTWSKIGSGEVQSLAINAIGDIFASEGHDMYRSTDNGNTWVRLIGWTNGSVDAFAFNPNGQIFAGNWSGVHRSTDNGDSWSQTSLAYVPIGCLAINASGHIFAGTGCEHPGNGVYRSTDNGDTWTPVNNGLSFVAESTVMRAIALNASGDIFAGVEGAGVYRSTDNGDNWAQINNGLINTCVQSLAINSNGDIFAGAFKILGRFERPGRGVYRSTDNGNTWTQIDLINVAPVNSLAINSSGHIFAGAGLWAFGGYTGQNGIFRSADNGSTWTQINNGLMDEHILALAINASGILFAGDDLGDIYRSIDNGDAWIVLNGWAGHDVNAFTFNSKGDVFTGTFRQGVYRSINNGDTWTQTSLANVTVECLAINTSGDIFAGTEKGVYRSADNGNTWTLIGLASNAVECLVINAARHIFVGMGAGVYRSTDNGDTWTQINGGLTTTAVNSIAINSNGIVFAGSDGYGVFRSLESTTAITETRRNQPLSFGLKQNFPNPFNPSTTIEFALPKASFVTLKIYDLLGNEVATLVAEKLPAGKHQRVWEAKGLASGVYVYRIEPGEFEETKKLILLR